MDSVDCCVVLAERGGGQMHGWMTDEEAIQTEFNFWKKCGFYKMGGEVEKEHEWMNECVDPFLR